MPAIPYPRCAAMNIAVPRIDDIAVGEGRNAPDLNSKADAEVALDIQVVAGVAPQARIVVYFTELSEPGLVAGVSRAVHGRATTSMPSQVLAIRRDLDGVPAPASAPRTAARSSLR
jgi:subtilase family serine protease